ncbi:SDR family NAD(P)-dependent oxidoreductase [Catellatospora coxensis]|uniref:Oxidoreductase n=1 Tax=Catellatospora coxensis TaxID=310354 RepID=A0A8J3KIL5_9ACTN|nr:SDR family oxidoreductase [Catellatospora coxensis]GIG03747.1 oxidoreductase [Catellatospora coxensis]
MREGRGAGVALVTGCSGDIGAAVCRRLHDDGYTVAGWDLAQPPADNALAWFSQVDLTAPEVPHDVVAGLAAVGPLRYVIHVVGGADVDELRCEDSALVPADVFRRVVAVNLFSAHTVLQATVGLMRESEGDRSYTFTSSTNAIGGYGAPGYSAAKAGLHGLVGALAGSLARGGIRINAVALGTTRTANYVRIGRLMGRETNFDSIGSRTLRGAVLSPDEAAAALVAIGIANPAISGEVVIADAGQHLARR